MSSARMRATLREQNARSCCRAARQMYLCSRGRVYTT